MRSRGYLIRWHIIDSLALAVVAGTVGVLIRKTMLVKCQFAIGTLATVGPRWLLGGVVVAFCILAVQFPRGFLSAARSLKVFGKHFGIIAKSAGAGIVCGILIKAEHGFVASGPLYLSENAWLLVASCTAGIFIGWFVARLREKGKQRIHRVKEPEQAKGSELDRWLADDRPIEDETEDRFGEHTIVARRISNRLLTNLPTLSKIFPKIALIGAYGSGKTSISNLVKRLYEKESNGEKCGKVVFCRYEAWQYLSPQAVVTGLVGAVAHGITKKIDDPAFWEIGDRYVEAARGIGSFWGALLTFLLGGGQTPRELLRKMADVLVRLDVRVVILVDDFDRIEERSLESRQALVQALNELQGIRNVQYLISVGPLGEVTRSVAITETTGELRRGLPVGDLIKLTQFQEVLLPLSPETVLEAVQELRDKAIRDKSIVYVWATTEEGQKVVLDWGSYEKYMEAPRSWGLGEPLAQVRPEHLHRLLVGLLNTPRALKAALRETDAAWEAKDGLKGEINWYELILINALKAAEPAVFEWIMRDSDMFQHVKTRLGKPKPEEVEQRKEEFTGKLRLLVEHKTPERETIVITTLHYLFPHFASKLAETDYTTVPSHLQSLSYSPIIGDGYFERFSAGEVPEGDIPDQPTLQYIRRITTSRFEPKEFEKRYLSSLEKLTGDLNKIVQFAALLPEPVALSICDTILAWIAVPQNASVWQEPDRYLISVMGDVYQILNKSREAVFTKRTSGILDVPSAIPEWVNKKLVQYGRTRPLVAFELLRVVIDDFHYYMGGIDKDELKRKLSDCILEEFVDGDQPFLPMFGPRRFGLRTLFGLIIDNPNFTVCKKTRLTRKLLAEADEDNTLSLRAKIILNLLGYKHPVANGEIPIESWTFSFDRQVIEQFYDMSLLAPKLREWYREKDRLPDVLAQKAFDVIAHEYPFKNSGNVDGKLS